MRRLIWIFSIFTCLTSAGSVSFSKDYFVYDHEQDRIIQMSEQSGFESLKTIGLNKNPSLMMETGIADQYIAVFSSSREKNDQGQVVSAHTGELLIFNQKTGRTEDLVDLGFAPYKWAFTKDRLHFFIAYYLSPSQEASEILHYSVREQKAEKVTGIGRDVVDLKVTFDEQRLMAVVNQVKNPGELLTFQIKPFQKKAGLIIGNPLQRIFVLGRDRAALVSAGYKKTRNSEYGRIRLIDTNCNVVTEERILSRPDIGIYWYEQNRSLFVTNGFTDNGLTEGRVYKVTASGIRQNQISRPWTAFSYLPEQNQLYILNDTGLTLIDYQKNSNRIFKLGSSDYYPGKYHYYFQRLSETNLAVISCVEKGYVKFYDLTKNQVLRSTQCGRSSERFINKLTFNGDLESRTTATTNQEQSRIYLLNCATKDITVYDSNYFKTIKYIVPNEAPLAMFQIKYPTLQTLVVTPKKLYKIDEEKIDLTPIQDFTISINKVYFFETKKERLVLYTDRLLVVLEPEDLKVRHSFYLYGDPNEKYTKLKKDEQRYYFIPEL